MKRSAILFLALLAACSPSEEEPVKPAQTFHQIMKDEIDPRADVILKIRNAAMDDRIGIDPARMSDTDWSRLAGSAASLREAALEIATMDPIVLTGPDMPIEDNGIPAGRSAAAIQARIDRDAPKLRGMAKALAAHANDIANAAGARDAARSGELVNQLEVVCETCHLEFWYPDDKALSDEILGKSQ